ncbi:MAG TPA: sigma-70 family RNA polymerase sigma factor [Gemmataceae bacterium]|jgi:RNA polymerase sigma-70 factor (ECF subfamily)|nr:sigma-70 family RNA polymerase sigma factor [Gemmataceae bacterium]
MPKLPEGRALLELLGAGDEEAARQVVDRYINRLVALARQRLSQRLASRVDPEDVVQSVFRTFFGRVKAGKFHIEDQDDLCKLLVRITVHKVLRQVEFHQAAKRDPHLEAEQGSRSQERLMELLDRDPSPEAAVAFLDQLEALFNTMTPRERQVLEMRLQGYSNDEIVAKLGLTNDRAIRRIFERIRSRAEQAGFSPKERD